MTKYRRRSFDIYHMDHSAVSVNAQDQCSSMANHLGSPWAYDRARADKPGVAELSMNNDNNVDKPNNLSMVK